MLDAVLVNFCPLSTTAGAQLKSPLLHPEGWGEDWEKGTHYWLCLIFHFYLLNDCVEEPERRIFDSRSWPRAKHFPVLYIMRKPNKVIVLLYIFLKQSAMEDTCLLVYKSLRTLHGRGAWKQGKLWTQHDNPISAADIGLLWRLHTPLYTDWILFKKL